jgi:hypothetical protein
VDRRQPPRQPTGAGFHDTLEAVIVYANRGVQFVSDAPAAVDWGADRYVSIHETAIPVTPEDVPEA